MEQETYKYYRIGTNNPVRVAFDAKGFKIGADAPDAATGTLKNRTTLLSVIESSPDVEEIDRKTFDGLCADVYAKKNFRPGGLTHLTM